MSIVGERGGRSRPTSSFMAVEDGERAGGGILACRALSILYMVTRFSTCESVTEGAQSNIVLSKFSCQVREERVGVTAKMEMCRLRAT